MINMLYIFNVNKCYVSIYLVHVVTVSKTGPTLYRNRLKTTGTEPKIPNLPNME